MIIQYVIAIALQQVPFMERWMVKITSGLSNGARILQTEHWFCFFPGTGDDDCRLWSRKGLTHRDMRVLFLFTSLSPSSGSGHSSSPACTNCLSNTWGHPLCRTGLNASESQSLAEEKWYQDKALSSYSHFWLQPLS